MYPGWGRHEPLLTAFDAHHAAVIRSDGVAARLRAHPGDRELLDRTLSAAEEVIATRAQLYRALMDLGWTPPAEVAADLRYDDVVRATPGA